MNKNNTISFGNIKSITTTNHSEIIYIEIPLKQGYTYRYILDFDNRFKDIINNYELFKKLKDKEKIIILHVLQKTNIDVKLKIIEKINKYLLLEDCLEQIIIEEIESEIVISEDTYNYTGEYDTDSLEIQTD